MTKMLIPTIKSEDVMIDDSSRAVWNGCETNSRSERKTTDGARKTTKEDDIKDGVRKIK